MKENRLVGRGGSGKVYVLVLPSTLHVLVSGTDSGCPFLPFIFIASKDETFGAQIEATTDSHFV